MANIHRIWPHGFRRTCRQAHYLICYIKYTFVCCVGVGSAAFRYDNEVVKFFFEKLYFILHILKNLSYSVVKCLNYSRLNCIKILKGKVYGGITVKYATENVNLIGIFTKTCRQKMVLILLTRMAKRKLVNTLEILGAKQPCS
jgi:hypothetical protein